MEEGGLFKMVIFVTGDGTHDVLLSGRAGYDVLLSGRAGYDGVLVECRVF